MKRDPVLSIGPRVTAFPVVHGSGDFAWELRRWMLAGDFDCLAVPLPPSFQESVEAAVIELPRPAAVLQREGLTWGEPDADDEPGPRASYVPIDPCQPVIAGLRVALGERMPRRFVDLETARFEDQAAVMPDPYALKRVPVQQFAAAMIPFVAPPQGQAEARVRHMAWQLRELSIDFQNILFVCPANWWPWVRAAFADSELRCPNGDAVARCETFDVHPQTLYFLFGELPYVTGLYETAREELAADKHLTIDGIKHLLIDARQAYRAEYGNRARRITPHTLRVILKYLRNLTLLERRLTPQLVDIVLAAKQVVGDGFARQVLTTSKAYRYASAPGEDQARLGIRQAALPDGWLGTLHNRLPGPPVVWRRLQLKPGPDPRQQRQWKQRWNPLAQCSWPPEDTQVERFRAAVFQRARQISGMDLATSEKFTTSLQDGIDIRDTLRHWYEGDIYVKRIPPSCGPLDAAVILFDAPADPRRYPWRTTWFAEHDEESTLAFYATDFRDQPVGPGICLATYGGALFLYPPRAIPDVWTNRHLDFAETLEERLLAAACRYSQTRQIALVSPAPPGPAWRRLARHFKRSWIHIPLQQFSDDTVQQLRMVHVLNGKQVRSYAADFIRRA